VGTPPTGPPVSRSSVRPNSSGPSSQRSRTSQGSSAEAWTSTPVYSYLKVYGLNQYGRAFVEAGFAELDALAKLSETTALDFLEQLHVYPGHRLRLLRAVDCLRYAALGSERKDVAQLLEDDAAFGRLCAENEELSKEKYEAESENARLQKENARLIDMTRQQASQLQMARDRMAELEDLVRAQTEQVDFLAQQLQHIAQENPLREEELLRSYKDSFDDWANAERIDLPDGLDEALSNAKAMFASKEVAGESPLAPSAELEITPPRGRRMPAVAPAYSPVSKAKLAMSLDSAPVKDCLQKFDVDHIIRCLAMAIQNKIILSLGRSRPHSAKEETLEACSIFLEPPCKEKLLRASAGTEDTLSLTRFSTNGSLGMHGTGGNTMPRHAFNSVAVRTAPGTWDIYGFLKDVMVNFRLEQEVSVITLYYLDRFSAMCGVVPTPDNWQRLTITAMMLASKVWNDESFENIEFAHLCPLYTLDEINAFERIFLKCVGYNMAVKTSDYAKTYFLLRTLGAKDSADFGLAPMDPLRASRLQERCLAKQIEFRERYPDELQGNALAWTL